MGNPAHQKKCVLSLISHFWLCLIFDLLGMILEHFSHISSIFKIKFLYVLDHMWHQMLNLHVYRGLKIEFFLTKLEYKKIQCPSM